MFPPAPSLINKSRCDLRDMGSNPVRMSEAAQVSTIPTEETARALHPGVDHEWDFRASMGEDYFAQDEEVL